MVLDYMDLELRRVLNTKIQVWELFIHYKIISTVYKALCWVQRNQHLIRFAPVQVIFPWRTDIKQKNCKFFY